MSTHNIGFYGELEKIIPELSPNIPPNEFSVIIPSIHKADCSTETFFFQYIAATLHSLIYYLADDDQR